MNPAQYWRNSKQLSHWIGKQGNVVEVTTVKVPPQELEHLLGYQLALVECEGRRRLWVVEPGCQLQVDDQVRIVLRRIEKTTATGVIPYHLVVTSIHSERK